MEQNHFNYIKSDHKINIKYPNRYKVANKEEVNEINKYAPIIKSITNFYDTELSNSKIDYVYKNKNNIEILPVKFLKENLSHLTGLNFEYKNAHEKFLYLKNGNNITPMIIERDNLTIKKLQVLDKLPNIVKANSSILTELDKVQQAQRIGFSKGIKDSHDELLIALQNFQPTFYQPRSLLNIKNSKSYDKVPNNTILGVFKEKSIINGIHVEPLSLNKNALDNMATTTEMLIGMKRYADELGRQLTHEKAILNRKEMAKKTALRKRLDRERD